MDTTSMPAENNVMVPLTRIPTDADAQMRVGVRAGMVRAYAMRPVADTADKNGA